MNTDDKKAYIEKQIYILDQKISSQCKILEGLLDERDDLKEHLDELD